MELIDFLKEFGLELAATLTVATLAFVVARFRRTIVIKIARLLLPELRNSGLIMTYSSMKDAMKSIKSSVEKTHDLKILSNKGTDWLGDDNAALSKLIGERSLSRLKLRVLLLSKIAPWLNAGWVRERGKISLSYVQGEFETAHKLVESYLQRYPNLAHKSGIRYHRDDPVWRMVMTDDRLFFSSYANPDQARDAVVFEFGGPNNEVYQAFKRHFNFLWHRRGVSKDVIEDSAAHDVKFDEVEFSAGGVVYCKAAGETKILIVERNDGLFTLPKGHVGKQERLSKAALREIHEETGLPLESLKIEKPIGWYPNPILVGDKARILKIVYYFLVRCENPSSTDLKTDPDHKSANWYSLSEAGNLKYAYSHVERVLYEAMSDLN